jgi:hypothetical protein
MSAVVIQSIRPYDTEAELLSAEGHAVRKGALLVFDQAPQPTGTAVRCEIKLRTGVELVRAEGVVVRYIEPTSSHSGALHIRLKRVTPATKAFLERAEASRAAGESSNHRESEATTASAQLEQPPEPAPATPPEPAPATPPEPAPATPPEPAPATPPEPAPAGADRTARTGNQALLGGLSARRVTRVDAPPARDELLERLRSRRSGNATSSA